MQRFFIALMALLCFNFAEAQEFSLASRQFSVSSLPQTSALALKDSKPATTMASIPGLRMRNTGRALTICGGVLVFTGIILMSSADALYYNSVQTQYGTVQEGDPQGALGVVMTVGGVGMAVPGIIFWSKGQKKYNRYIERQKASLGVTGYGLAVRYSF